MPFEKLDTKKLAKKIGVSYEEVEEKHRLIGEIVKARRGKKMSQAALGKKMGLSQARIAQIESGIGTAKITYDILFSVLNVLGLKVRVQVKKSA